MTLCPKCGTTNQDAAKFCKVCGAALGPTGGSVCSACGRPLRPGAVFCSSCGHTVTDPRSVSSEVQLCPHCGVTLRADARFCKFCGKALTETAAELVCPVCGGQLRAGVRFCRICGATVDAGHRQSPAMTSVPPPSPVRQSASGVNVPQSKQVIAGRYRILEKVAQGGMGAIYKAQDQRLNNKVVALKEVAEAAIAPEEREGVIASFKREAELLGRLHHPNLVRVTDLFPESIYHYMVMEFVNGATLEQLLNARQNPFPEAQVLGWAKQLCEVLQYLHSQEPPIIYRDIKPSNIMIVAGSEQIKLIDFGIARFYKPGKRKDTIQFGTDGYAPPEQYGSTQTDIRADVYALGAMLHQLLTLRDPQTKLFEFPSVRQLNPAISPRVEAAIQRALEGRRDARHASMAEFWQALSNDALTSGKMSAPPVSMTPLPDENVQPTPEIGAGKTMPTLTLGSVPRGTVGVINRVLAIPAGSPARLSVSVPWIVVQPDTLDQGGGAVEVQVSPGTLGIDHLQLDGNWLRRWWGWHTARLVPVAREHRGLVLVHYEEPGVEQYPISIIIQPTPLMSLVGWGLTIGLLLLEVGIPIGLLLALLAGIG